MAKWYAYRRIDHLYFTTKNISDKNNYMALNTKYMHYKQVIYTSLDINLGQN